MGVSKQLWVYEDIGKGCKKAQRKRGKFFLAEHHDLFKIERMLVTFRRKCALFTI
jgi:hypothetical protein